MNFEHAPQETYGKKLKPHEVARIVSTGGDVTEIQELCRQNSMFLTSGSLDQITGPSDSLRAILNRLSRGSTNDLSAFRSYLRTLVSSGLARQQEIFDATRNAWAEQNDHGAMQTTPFMQFTLAIHDENQADKNSGDVSTMPISFRRFASNSQRKYDLDNARLAASANSLILNILFHPDHTFRMKNEIEMLVTYVEQELDMLIQKAQ